MLDKDNNIVKRYHNCQKLTVQYCFKERDSVCSIKKEQKRLHNLNINQLRIEILNHTLYIDGKSEQKILAEA